jgi:uncharacterized protein (DUF2384 family)
MPFYHGRCREKAQASLGTKNCQLKTGSYELGIETAMRMTALPGADELLEGDQKTAGQRLSTPVRALGKKPKDLLSHKESIQQVRDVMGRLEHGIVT